MEYECKFRGKNLAVDRYKKNYGLIVTEAKICHPAPTFNGTHKMFRDNNDVLWIKFVNLDLQYLPTGLSRIFPRLKGLFISNCKFRKISRENLVGLEKLLELRITDCLLTTLPDDLFVDMTKLKNVDFSGNKIEFASSKLLKSFIGRFIEIFDLRGNKEIDAFFSDIIIYCGTCKSIEEFKRLIDEKCKKPENIGRKDELLLMLANKIASLWPVGRFSDFEIIAGTRKFQVHKNVLWQFKVQYLRKFSRTTIKRLK